MMTTLDPRIAAVQIDMAGLGLALLKLATDVENLAGRVDGALALRNAPPASWAMN